MHIIKHDLGSDVKEIEILPIGDAHIGSSHHLGKALQKELDYIRDTENVYCILNGDLINNNIIGSVGDVFTEKLNPQQQIDTLVALLEPIKHKILGVTSGNHSMRTYKHTGIDIILNVTKRLGIEHLYNVIANVIFVSFGKQYFNNSKHTFSIYHTHLAGGGKSVGNRANKLKEMTNVIDADIYIGSHLHTPMTFQDSYYRTFNNNKTVKEHTRLYCMTNAYEGYSNFPQRFNMTPSAIKQPKIILSYDRFGKTMKGVV